MRRVVTILAIVLAAAVMYAGETLDRVVARVDRHAIMRSDVEQEARFSRLVEGRGDKVTTHDEIAALERLIDRDLIADQIVVFGAIRVSKTEIDARISEMRKQIPNAESDSEWLRLLRQNGITPQDVENEVTQELRTLRFIDMRFRSEVRVGPRSLQTYYDTK